ncbi:MAG: hypothetical protein PVG78_02840 [Desulfobacterales bacterium]|jgi:hypothetical protein
MKKFAAVSISTLLILFFALDAGPAAARTAYEYGELVVVHRKSGNLKSSTTVFFFYGDGKEIRSHKSENDPRGLEARREAFKEFIETYTQRKETTAQPSIITVLNTLGSDGWEIIHFSDGQDNCQDGTTPQSTYLLKRRK